MSKPDNINLQAQKREAALLPAEGEHISSQAQETPIKIRNAILYSELEHIGDGEGFKFNTGGVLSIVVCPKDEAF